MRSFIFGSGLFSSLLTGLSLLKTARDDSPFTWRTALAWASWGITLALAIGSIVDTRRASKGRLVDTDSPIRGSEEKLLKKRLRR
ncbi:protein BatD [Microbacterium sp. SLBN-146]|uniref:protein BatD n=1 Tax=Microbacterium sp. SLBN-146 TaxID=2768457 RepID=UPI0011530002|nr:protein BatD [Microbacterium sp. SLBN-146]TQJ31863.1 hypothetical protein FBY39_2350 [Microbacterium sp. SLBN-146]